MTTRRFFEILARRSLINLSALVSLFIFPSIAPARCEDLWDSRGGLFFETPSRNFCETGFFGEIYRTVGYPSKSVSFVRTDRNGRRVETMVFVPFIWPTKDGGEDWLYIAVDGKMQEKMAGIPEDAPVAVHWQLFGTGIPDNASNRGCCARMRKALDIEILR